MKHQFSRILLSIALLSAPAQAQIVDNFQSYTVGQLPSPTWSDAGAVMPQWRIPSFPSAYVISTLDAFGNPTQAVTTVGDLATSKGIYATVPTSTYYSLYADVRIDQWSDAPAYTTSDWAMQLTFGQNGVDNWAYTPQIGIYASSLSQTWRIFENASVGTDIDLGVAAVVGTWYTVAQSFDVLTGTFHSQIFDTASGVSLIDQYDVVIGWNPTAAAGFDSFAFTAGDLSDNDTIGNIGVVDNVNVVATTTPEPASLLLLGTGMVLVGCVRRRVR